VSFLFLKSKLKAYLNIEIDQVDDPLKKSRDVKDIGHYSSGKTEVIIKGKSEIPNALSLINKHMKEVKTPIIRCSQNVIEWFSIS